MSEGTEAQQNAIYVNHVKEFELTPQFRISLGDFTKTNRQNIYSRSIFYFSDYS